MVLFMSGCDRFESQFRIGSCVQEIDKRYVSASNGKEVVYKINRFRFGYYLSVYRRSVWVQLEKKPYDYFYENEVFRFEVVKCPDYKEANFNTKFNEIDFSNKGK